MPEPLVSIITPYYNLGPVFLETVMCIQRMSFIRWEWIIVDDGSTDMASIEQLQRVAAADERIKVIRQENAGPGVARNTAVAHAQAEYLLQLDADDLVEPTFVEKALWLLNTQRQFAACGAYDVTFGAKELLWPHGFQEYDESIDDNRMTNHAIIRKSAWLESGGYDQRVSYEHADWDFWLNLAEIGQWGYTIPEYLVWYRTQAQSLLIDIESNLQRAIGFRTWLRQKHKRLRSRFPRPVWDMRELDPVAALEDNGLLHLTNPLLKPVGSQRVLLIVPWLEMGGADKFNIDLVRQLSQRGYQFTIVTTQRSNDPWKRQFTSLTPDVFCLPQFLRWSDYPSFISYLIESRGIDLLLVSNSSFGYNLIPYLRWRHPSIPVCDYNHLEEEDWGHGGYPQMSLESQDHLVAQLTCTEHLRQWMIAHGGLPEKIHVCYCGVDTMRWNRSLQERTSIRARLKIPDETPVVIFVGRFVDQKQPLVFAQVVEQTLKAVPSLIALMIGSGPDVPQVKAFIKQHHLEEHLRLEGAITNEETRDLVGASDVLLLPSKREGLALALYEAMALGVVPIAADVGGQSELVTSETGILVAPGINEVARYSAALTQVLTQPAMMRQMATTGKEIIAERFTSQQMGEAMDGLLSEALLHEANTAKLGVSFEQAIRAARVAVANQRRLELSELALGDSRIGRMVRQTRRHLFPMGTSRYERYKSVRRLLRGVTHRVSSMPRYISTGKVQEIPKYAQAWLIAQTSQFHRQ